MERVWLRSGRVLAGMLLAAMYAMPQAYTVSARPGAVNYIEGTAYIDGTAVSDTSKKTTFLSANDTLSTDKGKAEVLLTPGVFLRLGDNSEIRMISPSLTDTQVEVDRGEVMVEAAGLLKDNNIQIADHGASIMIAKNGLYRFTGEAPPTAAVLEGKADVRFGDQKISLGKNHQTVLTASLKSEKFDSKKEDDLYAWSNVRSQYDAAASYAAAKSVTVNNYGPWGGYGWYSPGWFWDPTFSSWAWLPGDGAFFSPFGYGFYGPGLVGYAPVVVAPVYRGGHWNDNGNSWNHNGNPPMHAPVPVNANRPPAVGAVAGSPWANHLAREQAAHSFAANGFRTASGAPAATFTGGHSGAGAHPPEAGGFHGSGTPGGFHGGGPAGTSHGGGGGAHR